MKFKELEMQQNNEALHEVLQLIEGMDELSKKGNTIAESLSNSLQQFIGHSTKNFGILYAGCKQLFDTINKA
jgi:hypothetical protein